MWSQTQKLQAWDQGVADNRVMFELGYSVALWGESIVMASRNDDNYPNTRTGSVYVWRPLLDIKGIWSSDQWSQNQKLVCVEMQLYASNNFPDMTDMFFGNRVFARSIALHDTTLAVGIENLEVSKRINRETVFLFMLQESGDFTQLQNLFVGDKDCKYDMYNQKFGDTSVITSSDLCRRIWQLPAGDSIYNEYLGSDFKQVSTDCCNFNGSTPGPTIGAVTGRPVEERLAGSLAGALAAVAQGAKIIRVHDVAETVDALKVWRAATID